MASRLHKGERKKCDNFILEYYSDLIDLNAAAFTTEEVCIFLKICNRPKFPEGDIASNDIHDGNDFKPFKEPLLKGVRPLPDTGEGCFFCTEIMNSLALSTANRKDDEEVKEVMFKVCENLPDTSSYACLDWLRKYVDVVIDALGSYLLKEVCERINVCTRPGVMMSPSMHMNSWTMGVDDCFMCQEVSSEIKTMVEHAQGSITIDDAMRSVCARLPLATVSQVSATGVLPKVKLFTADWDEFEEGSIACNLCMILVDHFHKVLSLNNTVLDYKKGMLNICRRVRSFNEDCANLVEPNFDKIYEDLQAGRTTKDVCVDAKHCHGNAASAPQLLLKNIMLTQDEDYHVDENMHPLKLSYACEAFVTDKGQGLNDGFARNLTIQELCASIGSCASEDVEPKRDVLTARLRYVQLPQDKSSSKVFDGNSPTTAEQFDAGECKMCQFVLTNLKEQIPNAKGQTPPAEIKSGLIGLCAYLRKPESKTLCADYVTDAGENIIDVLTTVNPQEICIRFLACPASSASPSQSSQSAPGAPRFFSVLENRLSGNKESPLSLGPLKSDDDEKDDELDSKKKVTTVPMPVLETDDCTACMNMAEIVFQMVNDEIPLELDQALQRACSVIHPLYHPACLELMEKYREQLRIKILMFPRLFPTEYCTEFNPPVCAPSPMYGLAAVNFHPNSRVRRTADVQAAVLNRNAAKDEDVKSELCKLCQHAMFKVGPLMSNPDVSFKEVYNAVTNSCNSFSGDEHQQCVNMINEHRFYMEAKLFGQPRTPFYQVCYQMTNPLCSAEFINPALRSKLMDAFLSEFPKGLKGNEQAFELASEVSDFASTIMYFANPDSINFNSSDGAESCDCNCSDESSTDSTTESSCSCSDIGSADSTAKSSTIDLDDEDAYYPTSTGFEDKDEESLCEICNEVIGKVKPYIQIPVLQNFLKTEIEKSCYDIQPLHFSKCIKFVAKYSSVLKVTALYDISRRTEDICTLTVPQFCQSSEKNNLLIDSKKWHSVTDLRDIDKIDKANKRVSNKNLKGRKADADKEALVPYVPVMIKGSEVIPNFVPAAAVPVSDCVICNKIVENIEPQIQGSKNMEEIKDRIMTACFSIQREYFSQCLEFLPKYGPHLRDSIISDSNVPPSQICQNTQTLFCAPIAPEIPLSPIVPSPKQVHVNFKLPEKKLHRLGSGSLMREIALKVCEKIIEKLLSGMEEVCTAFINRHFPEEENSYGGPLNSVGGIKDCDVCQEMMTVLSMRGDNSIDNQFSSHDELRGSCQYLPAAHRWLCEGVLRKYGDKIEPYLEDPSKDYMNVCDNLQPSPCRIAGSQDNDEIARSSLQRQFVNQVLTQHYLVHRLALSDDQRHEDTSPDCLLCQDMVKEIRKRLVIDHSKPVKVATAEVCQYLPEVSRHNCSEIVLASGSKIEEGLHWFVYDSPSYVCEQSELCDPYKIDTDSRDVCKEGPDFWCLSFQNADQCDQIEYCQAKFRQDDD